MLQKGNKKIGTLIKVIPNPNDMLQQRVDETKSCYYLFYSYSGTKPDIVKNLDTSNVTSMHYMFYNCNKLTNLDISKFDTSSVQDMGYIFYFCQLLETINGELDLISCTNVNNMFNSCKALTTVTLKNIKKTLTIGSGTNYGTLLTHDTIINTFKELWDLTGSTAQTLTLSTPSGARTEEIYVKLIDVTDEMRAEDQYIDNKKPCIVCESTDEGAMTLKEYGISKNWNISY